MLDTKIILVDGMPGTGKSSVSQFIHLQLHAGGQSSYWLHEEGAAHPVRLFYDSQRHCSWSGYSEQAISRWQSYVHELYEQDVLAVLDAAILQNHVRSMLIFDCARDAIHDLVHRIENLLASLNPVLIYLSPSDVEGNFRNVAQVRGQRMLELWIEAHDQYPYTREIQSGGYPGFIAFWQEFGELSDKIFKDLDIRKLRLNSSVDDWDAHGREILDFLDLPILSERYLPPGMERLIGKYVPVDGRTAPGVMVEVRDGCLIASVDQPTFDVRRGPIGCFRESRLIPISENRYHVAAWPHEVQFIEGKLESVVKMEVSISEEGWERSKDVYVKQ